MRQREWSRSTATAMSLLAGMMMGSVCSHAQLQRSDYEQALDLPDRYRGFVDHLPESPAWIEGTDRFVYREGIRTATGEKAGGFRFVLVDAKTQSTAPAFDAQRLAEALTKATGAPVKPDHLPFSSFHFEDGQSAIRFSVGDDHWNCHLADYACTKKQEEHDPDDEGYDPTPKPENGDEHAVKSPDGHWKAYVLNHNLVIQNVGLQIGRAHV